MTFTHLAFLRDRADRDRRACDAPWGRARPQRARRRAGGGNQGDGGDENGDHRGCANCCARGKLGGSEDKSG